jgi:CRISPR system Cascade subunit CasE
MAEGIVYESKVVMASDMRRLHRLTANGGSNPRVFAHRAVWSLLADDRDKRDFLFSVTGLAPFSAILRTRGPVPQAAEWCVESYPLETHFEQGRVLRFRLEAVAEVARSVADTRRSKRMDIVLDALRQHRELQEGSADDLERAFAEPQDIAAKAARDWMEAQGRRRGFEIVERDDGEAAFAFVDHQRHRMRHRNGPIQAGSITVEGLLRVTDPVAFSEALSTGFGRLKAYGFGLMQIRPA